MDHELLDQKVVYIINKNRAVEVVKSLLNFKACLYVHKCIMIFLFSK
jgi:hypothetical protein